jgi:hypothetical protein
MSSVLKRRTKKSGKNKLPKELKLLSIKMGQWPLESFCNINTLDTILEALGQYLVFHDWIFLGL